MNGVADEYIKSLIRRYDGVRSLKAEIRMGRRHLDNIDATRVLRRVKYKPRRLFVWRIVFMTMLKEYYDKYGFIPPVRSISRAVGCDYDRIREVLYEMRMMGLVKNHRLGMYGIHEILEYDIFERAARVYECLRENNMLYEARI